jgi:hypothetical protein
VEAGESDSGLRPAELLAAFSLATDLGLGQPMEHVLRSWVIAARLGDHMGVELDDRGALYYVATLAWVGCVADTPEVAAWFGDDIAFRRDSFHVDLAGLPMLGFMLRHVGSGTPALAWAPARAGCDGSGYHRCLTAPAIPKTARVLAAACAFRAMTEPRPHRPAMTATSLRSSRSTSFRW